MHIVDESGRVSLTAALIGMALLAMFFVSCSERDAAPEPVEVPRPESTATTRGENSEAAPPDSTPTPYSRRVPSPVVVTATAATEVVATATSQTVVPTPSRTTLAVNTPTAPSPPTAEPSVVSKESGWPTPREIYDRLDWGPFIDRGHFFKRVSEGKSIRIYLGPNSTRKVTCNPDIGTAFDGSNPTWSDNSHWIWVWVESGDARNGCWGLSKYEDWLNKPLPSKPLTVAEIRARHTAWGEDLTFSIDDSTRDFSVPPRDHAEGYPRGSRKRLDDGWLMECDDRLLPWGGWTNQRGFYTVSIEDEEAQMRERWTPGQVARKEEARDRGWYFIVFRSSISQGYCWQVPNYEEIPPHWPCLQCQWRSHD